MGLSFLPPCVYWTVLSLLELFYNSCKQEALRERRPPWPRQIITPILPSVKMLSLGGGRLRFWINTYTTIWFCYRYYGVFCSFIKLRIPGSPPKFNQFFIALPRTYLSIKLSHSVHLENVFLATIISW